MLNKKTFIFFLRKILFFFLLMVLLPFFAHASVTDGTIDSVNKYAKGLDSNVGKINFGLALGNVHVTDAVLTGNAWSTLAGWINLAPTNGGVTNDAEGHLSGYAWGQNVGWVNFAPTQGGVTIDSSGIFHGYAWSQNLGWISFNCANDGSCGSDDFKVATDWRPLSTRTPTPPPGGGGGGGGGHPPPPHLRVLPLPLLLHPLPPLHLLPHQHPHQLPHPLHHPLRHLHQLLHPHPLQSLDLEQVEIVEVVHQYFQLSLL